MKTCSIDLFQSGTATPTGCGAGRALRARRNPNEAPVSRPTARTECAPYHRNRAFTLPELMIASTVFVFLMGAVIYTFLFGLTLNETTRIKLGASDDARKSLAHLVDEIRSATRIKVGNLVSTTNFVEVATNAAQTGVAIQIYPTSDTNFWVRYYYQTNKLVSDFGKLCRTTSTNTGGLYTLVMGHSISNTVPVFAAEDSNGQVLSNNVNNRVIGVYLQFNQIEYPVVKIGPGNYYDYYQLHTRITRRRLF